MTIEQDVFEWRRFSHWDSSAAKARLSAFVLWEARNSESVDDLAERCGHRGSDAALGLIEAFRRESAVALELIVKAVIASKLRARGADPAREGVPATHDLPQLWQMAGLPTLPDDDVYRLHLVKQTLMWSGRYATPRTPKAWEEENRALTLLEPPVGEKERFRIVTPIILEWSDFDRLYQIAQSELERVSKGEIG